MLVSFKKFIDIPILVKIGPTTTGGTSHQDLHVLLLAKLTVWGIPGRGILRDDVFIQREAPNMSST
jgi:hypothetical protein